MAVGTILLVDYHPEVLGFSKAALSRCSYDVLTANTGEEALDILGSQAHIDLVVSEVLMASGLSGPALVGKIRESYPSTAVMLMTGFSDQQLDGSVSLLQKPFTAAALVGRVQQVLSESGRVAEALQKTAETNVISRRELESARFAVRDNLRESRKKRLERFRSYLREPGAVIPTILVVDDDPAFRYAVCRSLSRLGFTVLEARDGQEALELSREHRGSIDVLLTDIRMPGLDGLELAQALGTERPRTSIVFMTADDIDLPYAVVRKPLDFNDLASTLITLERE